MTEKKRSLCIICGLVEVEGTSVCPNCSDNVRRQAGGGRDKIRKEADRELKRHGINPAETDSEKQP